MTRHFKSVTDVICPKCQRTAVAKYLLSETKECLMDTEEITCLGCGLLDNKCSCTSLPKVIKFGDRIDHNIDYRVAKAQLRKDRKEMRELEKEKQNE